MPGRGELRARLLVLALLLVFASVLGSCAHSRETYDAAERKPEVSDHFDGKLYFNPPLVGDEGRPAPGRSGWIWRWVFGTGWPEWPKFKDIPAGPRPVEKVAEGVVRVTPVGHSTFLIQMDGLNMLTDPIWSERASPVSFAGPKRHKRPGINFDDLPPIDAVLVSHNHYDHLDMPTLKRLAGRGTVRCVVPLGNLGLVRSAGLSRAEELDWWESVRLSPDVTVTLVPAHHFSARTLWDRNKTLWGGFVVSGRGGHVFYAGDTGYGPHFKQIALRFPGIRIALLPIAPFRPERMKENQGVLYPGAHMGPLEAAQAHVDLGAERSIAAHYQVFQLGADGFDEAVAGLAQALAHFRVDSDAFIVREPGEMVEASGIEGRRQAANAGSGGGRP